MKNLYDFPPRLFCNYKFPAERPGNRFPHTRVVGIGGLSVCNYNVTVFSGHFSGSNIACN